MQLFDDLSGLWALVEDAADDQALLEGGCRWLARRSPSVKAAILSADGLTLLAADGKLLVLGEHGQLAALAADPRRARILAMTQQPILTAPCYSAPALYRGRLYLRNERELLCLDLRTR